MQFGSILLLSVGLAMDAMAVSAASGLQTPRILPRHVALVAGFFGGFQALMPWLGWVLGSQVGSLVATWGHWIAFLLLGFIGAKMLWEARSGAHPEPDGEEKASSSDRFSIRVLFVLAIATSIDALAAGISLSLVDAPILLSVLTIGITTALLSAIGLFAGRHFGSLLGRRLDVFGGLVLIGLGIKILFEN